MMDIGTATLAFAASCTDRAHDLIQDGWVKGAFATGFERVEQFCILGALDLALDEMDLQGTVRQDVRDIAILFIMDEAFDITGKKQCSIPGFNDASERKHDEVLEVLGNAAMRLWNLSVEQEDIGATWTPSKWADVDVASAESQQYLNAVLA